MEKRRKGDGVMQQKPETARSIALMVCRVLAKGLPAAEPMRIIARTALKMEKREAAKRRK